MRQWQQFFDTIISFPIAVGMVDGTIHRVRHPSRTLTAELFKADILCRPRGLWMQMPDRAYGKATAFASLFDS